MRADLSQRVQAGLYRNSSLFYSLSCLFGAGAICKNWLYDHRCLPVCRLPACVVSVGNLVAGGAGKTPLVHLLAQMLFGDGPVAILARGYRANPKLPLGDELTMLSRRLKDVRCYADPDRVSAGRRALSDGKRLLILDDGFQYRRLFRDFDLVIVDAANPFGYEAFLPCGTLRDPPRRLQQADAVFVNGPFTPDLAQMLTPVTKAPLIEVKLACERIVDLAGAERKNLAGCKVGAFCAIAQPRRFLSTLRELSIEPVGEWFLPDHELFDFTKLSLFADRCREKGATALLCTHKDAVKIEREPCLPIYYLEMQYQIISGQAAWANLIEKIRSRVNNYPRV